MSREYLEQSNLKLNYDLMLGRFLFNDLPPIKTRSIRLFLCAPYTDTFEETNHLFNKVFPKLREYTLSRFGFEFQAVNLNWDVDTKKNLIEDSLIEIEKCKAQSIGMTFLSLIGDEYGKPSLPAWFDREQFDIVIKCLKEARIDCSLLEKLYKLNINYLTNRYELTEIDLTQEDESSALELYNSGIRLAIENKISLNDNLINELNQSTLQKFMSEGAFKNDSKNNRVFSFIRIDENATYQTQLSNKINTLDYLRDKEINYYFPADQIYRIRISKKNETYLNNFGLHYQKLFERLIDKFVQANPELEKKVLFDDVVYHLNYIRFNKITELAAGSLKLMKELSDYILDDNNRQPLILSGPLGSGKTSCLATFSSNLYLQLAAVESNSSSCSTFKKHAIIVRFIGIDNSSIQLRSLLKSLCLQLDYIKIHSNDEKNLSKTEFNNLKVTSKLSDLKKHFKSHLTQSNESSIGHTKLVIILDSLQDLSKNDNSYKLDWLPKHLGPSCKLILALSSESEELMGRLKRKYTNERSYYSLDYLGYEQAEFMIRKCLASKKYRLEEEQINLVKNLIQKKPILSLHLKILSESFLKWESYRKLEDCILKDTLRDAILFRIIEIERKYGFSECELQDLLSLDNELLKEFKSKDLIKQTSDSIRIPWFYISRALNDISNHLLIKPFQGFLTISMRHQVFNQIIYDRYLRDNQELLIYLHKNISEYFLGTWSNAKLKPLYYEKIIMPPKPTDSEKLSTEKPIIKRIKMNLNRLVPFQPIKYEDYHTHIKPRYNVRKLLMLPYHLIKAKMIKEIFEHVYFNIEWIYYKIVALSLQDLLSDFDLYKNDVEVDLVVKSLKMSDDAICENPKLLFSELTSRLLPFINSYENISKLIKQCDEMGVKLNPLLPIGPIFNSPSWIYEETLDLGMKINENLQIDLLESKENGRILALKNNNSLSIKFFDLDLLELTNEISTAKGIVYCNKNSDFVCIIENNSKLVIKRIENGEWYGNVEFEYCEIGHVYMSVNYATITLRKIPSPLLINLKTCEMVKKFPYQTCFSTISLDETVLLIHSEKYINYYSLPQLDRKIILDCIEIPESVLFIKNNTQLYVLSKDTKQITFYNLVLAKKYYTSLQVLQDREIIGFKMSSNDSLLIVCSLFCIYVLDSNSENKNILFKLNASSINNYLNSNNELTHSRPSSSFSYISENSVSISSVNSRDILENKLKPKNTFNGFGCTLNNRIIYATLYTYLICFDADSGSILRIFQSTVSANRIIKSYSSRLSDLVVSLLDNGKIILWNLASVSLKNIKFDEFKIYNDSVVDCILTNLNHNVKRESQFFISYSNESPDARVHNLKNYCSVSSILKSCNDENVDNPLTCKTISIDLDESGRYCLIVCDVDEFVGKRFPEEVDFNKRLCSLIDLSTRNHSVIQQFSFIIRKNSRFQTNVQFINADNETYLVMKTVSCINDFDRYSLDFDWSDFETSIKVYGPISPVSSYNGLMLFDEFKMIGEQLNDGICINRQNVFASLMQECNKLFDKHQPNLVKAKRYEVHLNVYDFFEYKKKAIKVQSFSLNEFLTQEEFSAKNILIDIREIYTGHLLLIYSKEGARLNNSQANFYEYDYDRFKFRRDINTVKGAILYDVKNDQVIRKYSTIFSKETNVESLLVSKGNFILDNCWNLYDINNGQLIRNVKLSSSLNFNYSFTKFLLNGRYLISPSSNKINTVYLIRCYDLAIVASIRINGEISCLKVGEFDRTISVGTQNGNVFGLKLLIDLEFDEAVGTYIGFYRNYNLNFIKKTDQNISNKRFIKMREMSNGPCTPLEKNLDNDIKRVIHSAHAYRKLTNKESRVSSMSSYLSENSFLSAAGDKLLDQSHSGLVKINLTNLTSGIKHSPLNRQTTRACNIQ